MILNRSVLIDRYIHVLETVDMGQISTEDLAALVTMFELLAARYPQARFPGKGGPRLTVVRGPIQA